uniref:cholesterol 7-desaturase n=1 Tax=Drosophila pachea TaxID=103846 RepID=J9PYJ7_9MUSC|nr:neverland [Drosophila pachea]AFD97330.1 neverland [Drosophila pachea]AFD97331.1 neverland [Drosophila pachea]AFD97332.1 neverland [Drosophila pachea]AFD97333.1 neverland [Drosophila pachea]
MDLPTSNFSTILMDLKTMLGHDNFSTILFYTPCVKVLCSIICVILLLYWLFFIPLNWTWYKDQWEDDVNDNGINCNSKRSAINRLRSTRLRNNKELPPPYPNGWYGILESSKLRAGESKHISCLGEQLIVFRSQAGEVYILDAYCPHLGANLSKGGRVIGDNIECPFHHWSFRGSDGMCTNIPYSSNIHSSTKTKKWTSTEVNGFIFLWYNVEESEVPWNIPKSVGVAKNELIYLGRSEFYVNCHIQEIPENAADLGHFQAIHDDNVVCGYWNQKRSIFSILGYHKWTASWNCTDLSHVAELNISHTFNLFGKLKCLRMNVIGKQIGPSYVHIILKSPTFGDVEIFQTIIPVEPLVQKVIHRFYSSRKMAPITKFFVFTGSVMFQRDMSIWNHKQYRSNPMLVLEETPLKKFRKWYAQFYTVNSKSFQVANNHDW